MFSRWMTPVNWCVGVSTSGYPWKYPGRVGDSSLPGAGNYCDVRYGGAACTGRGELSMRVTGAREVVDNLARGEEPDQACRRDARSGGGAARPVSLGVAHVVPHARWSTRGSRQPERLYLQRRAVASGDLEVIARSTL